MNKEHLTYFKVENFKRFDSLELTDIGQFNLIVGDNNVGKTSVLEALLFDKNRQKCLGQLHKILFNKGINIQPERIYEDNGAVLKEVNYPKENFWHYLAKNENKAIIFRIKYGDIDEHISIRQVVIDERELAEWRHLDREDFPYFWFDNSDTEFMGISPDGRYLSFERETEQDGGENGVQVYKSEAIAGLYAHCLFQDITKLPLPIVAVSLPGNGLLIDNFADQTTESVHSVKNLVGDMRCILNKISDVRLGKIGDQNQLMISLGDSDKQMPISFFGESVTRATEILLEISKYRGKRLMIDEIDTGIHYSRMKNFLKTIFQVALKNEVQLFMTTHSIECQQAFEEVFEDTDMEQHQGKARQFSLIETPEGKVVANPFKFEQLQYALEIGFETRGGKRGW